MLTIKCAGCKNKLFKYEKIGQGEVLRCYKSKIKKFYKYTERNASLYCICGQKIATETNKYFKMIQGNFIYTRTKKK